MKAIFTIVLLAAAVGLVFWIARPLWNGISVLREESARVADAVSRLRQLRDIRDKLLDTYKNIPKSKLDRLEELLPEKPDSGAILISLEKLTRDRGIRLRRIEFLKDQFTAPSRIPAQASQITKKTEVLSNSISYNFTVSANYDAFRSLLSALEKNLRLIDISDIAFSGGSSNLFEFTFRAKSYYQK